MKIMIFTCASLVVFFPLIASSDDKHKENKPKQSSGGKAAHAAAGPGAQAHKSAPKGAGRATDHQDHSGGAQHNAGNSLQPAGQKSNAEHDLNSHQDTQHGLNSNQEGQHGLNSHQESQHGLNSHQETKHGLTSHQDAKHCPTSNQDAQKGINSHQGTRHSLNARAGNAFEGHHAARPSANHPNYYAGHWRSGQHWRNYHALYSGYHRSWHDRGWWRGHYSRVVYVGGNYWGGNWYWDGGYWFPAWGYEPGYSGYVYDGPIFAYDNLPPDQVVVNIQEALQDQGYYAGEIDGQLGQQTRDALAAYQRDHNLELTAAIDEATVQALGLTTAEEV